jgi:hypothetical protein
MIIFTCMLSVYSVGNVEAASILEKENNDTIQSANSIKLNTSYSGSIKEWDYWGDQDQDYFKISLPSDGNLTLSIANKVGIGWNMKLLDGNGSEYNSVSSLTSVNVVDKNIKRSEVSIGLPKGTYYILLEGTNEKSEGITYEFTLKHKASAYYQKEFNDYIQTSNNIALNKSYSGVIEYWDYWSDQAKDYYRIVLPNDGNVILSLGNKVGVGWKITLIDGNGTKYRSIDSNTSVDVKDKGIKNSEISAGLPKGTYYVLLEGLNETSIDVPYSFSVKYQASPFYEKEFNDSIETANNIVFNKNYSGVIEYYDYWSDQAFDFYRIQLSQSTEINIQLHNKIGSIWNFEIQNGSGEVLQTGSTDRNSNAKSSFTYQLNKGVYYIKIHGDGSTVNIPYKFSVNASLPTPIPNASLIAVTNNTGKADLITVKGLKVGDIVKVYNQAGKLIGTSKAVANAQTSTSVSINQLGTESSKLSVTVTNSGMKESGKRTITYQAEKISAKLSTGKIAVKNNRGENDTVTISSLSEGDVIKVYDKTGKNVLATSQPVAKGKTSMTVSIKQLGTKAGSILVSIANKGKLESGKTSKSFSGELSSTPPSVNNMSVTVALKIDNLKAGDIVKIYDKSGKLLTTSKPVPAGQKSMSVNIKKSLGKLENVYITVTHKGSDESSKVAVTL